MFEVLLIAQCALTLPNGTREDFDFCGKTSTQISPQPATEKEPNPIQLETTYKHLTKKNYERWQIIADNKTPKSNRPADILAYARFLFGPEQTLGTEGREKEVKQVKWEEGDRTIEASFQRFGFTWLLIKWEGKGFQ